MSKSPSNQGKDALVTHQPVLPLVMQAALAPLVETLRSLLRLKEDQVIALCLGFLIQNPTPAGTFRFEQQFDAISRESNRQVLETVLNDLDPDIPTDTPPRIESEGSEYRRRHARTAHSGIATLFGNITLLRYSYRSCDESEASIVPLEDALGIVAGCTPALAEKAARLGGQAGATQRTVLDTLRRENKVIMGQERLRHLWQSVSVHTEPLRRPAQAKQVCDWLRKAFGLKGIKPTLAVGRDGITMPNQSKAAYEVASCGTITVYAGKQRLGTVYLGYIPESGQGTMTDELLALINEILSQWHAESDQLPQLGYISDCGELEEGFYTSRLSRMRHPVTTQRLSWQRIVDYYHAALRLTSIADALNLDDAAAKQWSRRMRQLLKGPQGVSRILHSAAALAKRYGFKNEEKEKEYKTACNYLRKRSEWMRYDVFRERGLPIGSGVTEAGCKTLFTQRLKQSGMRWKHPGMQTVLNLRVLIMSGVWDKVYAESLNRPAPTNFSTYNRTQPVVSQETAVFAA